MVRTTQDSPYKELRCVVWPKGQPVDRIRKVLDVPGHRERQSIKQAVILVVLDMCE